jgi:hypothetical protein
MKKPAHLIFKASSFGRGAFFVRGGENIHAKKSSKEKN